MKKVVIFTHESYSHNISIKSIIRILISNGYKVYVFGGSEFENMYKDYNVKFFPYIEKVKEEINSKYGFNHKEEINFLMNKFTPRRLFKYVTDLRKYEIRMNIAYVDSIIDKVIGISPDLILRDACSVFGRIIGKRLGIKTIGYICNVCVTEEMIMKDICNVLSNCWGINVKKFGSRNCENLYYDIKKYNDELCDKMNISRFPVIYTVDSGEDYNIVFSSNLFQGELDKHKYGIVRYEIFNDEYKIDYGLRENIIYVSSGTVVSHNVYFYIHVMEAFKNSKFQIIISGKSVKRDIKESGYSVPRNVHIEDFVNQKEILKKAKLFMSHGGYNSICEAIYYEVPLIINPIASDQFNNAVIVDSLGVGIDIRRIVQTPNNIKKISKFLMENEVVKNNIKKVKSDFARTQPVENIAGEILNV